MIVLLYIVHTTYDSDSTTIYYDIYSIYVPVLFLDFKYHEDYENLWNEKIKNISKAPNNLP